LSRVDGDHLVSFDLDGPGSIAGVDNGDPTNHEAFKGPTPAAAQHRAFNGLALVVVKSARTPGTIVVRARAEGLKPAEIRIEAK
jgi:beta-galactosidase